MGNIEIATIFFRLKSVSGRNSQRRCSIRKTWSLKLCNIYRKITVLESFLVKAQPASLLKRDSNTDVFFCMLGNF